MKTEALHKIITAFLAEIFIKKGGEYAFKIKPIKHNGAAVSVMKLVDADTPSGYTLKDIGYSLSVYGIAGVTNIKTKLETAAECI